MWINFTGGKCGLTGTAMKDLVEGARAHDHGGRSDVQPRLFRSRDRKPTGWARIAVRAVMPAQMVTPMESWDSAWYLWAPTRWQGGAPWALDWFTETT